MTDMTDVFLLDVTFLNDDERFDRYYRELSPQRKARTDRYHQRSGKNLSIGASVALNCALHRFGRHEKEMSYITSKNGKPYFQTFNRFFNISHSGTLVLCSLSEKEIGCDVQLCQKTDYLPLARRFFTQQEYHRIFFSETPCETFYRMWTIKESYLKFTGDGIGKGLQFFSVDLQGDTPQIFKDGKKEDVFVREYPYREYCIAVCSAENNLPDAVTWIVP